MSANHTPGPWGIIKDCHYRVEQDDTGYTSWQGVGPERGLSVALIVSDGDCHDDEFDANRRLIAAAPDLLTVLSEVMPYLEEGYMEDEDDDEPIGWCADSDGTNQRPIPLTFGMVRRARAAIAKARGEA